MSKYYKIIGVPKIAQTEAMSCWFASARMVFHTFACGPVFGAGQESSQLFLDGLSNSRFLTFARQNGLVDLGSSEEDMMKNASSHSKGEPGLGFQDLAVVLDRYGPIWTSLADKHIVVLTGVEDGDNGAQVIYNDPADGAEHRMKLGGPDDTGSFNQIVRWRTPGVMLHYPQREKRRAAMMGAVSLQLGVVTS